MRHLLVLLPAVLAIAVAQEHFLDVRALVKETIDAFKDVPALMQNQNQTLLATASSSSSTSSSPSLKPEMSTVEPAKVVKARSDVYDSLLKLPGDIMSQLARDAGFVDEKSVEKEPEVKETKAKQEEERVEKKRDDEESFSFKTVDDVKAEERREMNERPTPAKRVESNDDIFSISKLISVTGNAFREAQAAQQAQAAQNPQQPQQEPMMTLPPLVPLPPVPLQMPAIQLPATVAQPATEIMYRPVTKDGKTVYEQVVVLKDANGSVKLLPNTVVSKLPESANKIEIKNVNQAAEFMAPTFPPVVNLFEETPTTVATTTTTTEEPEVTTTEEPVKPRRKSLPRRKIHYVEKKGKDMHSRQFGAKTVQMSDPIEIQAQEEQEPVNVLQKEGNLRVHAINRRRMTRKPRVVRVEEVEKEEEQQVEEEPEEEPEEVTEPPKKRRKVTKKVKKTKKEIRKLPDLYDEQWKTQVAPSVSPPSEDFAEQFDGVDEAQVSPKMKSEFEEPQKPQNDTPMNDPIEQRSSKVQMFTKEQEEELINKEIRKRVMQRIRLSKLKSSEKKMETTTTEEPTTEAPTTEAPTEAPTTEQEKMEEAAEEEEEEVDATEEAAETEEEEQEEEVTTTTTTTTTTEAPVTRAHRSRNHKRAVVTKHQCLNLRSFSRQFLFNTIGEFANEHCYFIENYYPVLTCSRVPSYVAKCKKLLKDEE